MPELDQMNPEMEPTQPEMGGQVVGLEPGQTDEEGAMAKADLYKLANYSFKLFKKLEDNAQLEGWVQAKITKAADYIASVYHYLEYEMEFSEYGHKLDNSDVLSEGQKRALKNKLMEAKAKIKELKVKQAKKAEVAEGAGRMIGGGKEESCTECGGTGMRLTMGMPVPDHVEKKIEKYKRLTKATYAAHKRLDKNGDGIVSKEEEEASKGVGEGTTEVQYDQDGKRTGVKHTSTHKYSDEPHTEPKSQAKSRSASDKAGDKASDKAAAKDSKDYEKKNPGTVTRVKDGKKIDPNAPKEKEVDETYGQGVYEAKKKGDGNLANNAKPYDKVTRGDVIAGRLGKDEKGGKSKKVVEEPNEGNEFSGELVKAKASGAKEFKVDGKTFPVKEAATKTMSRAAKGHEKYGKEGMAEGDSGAKYKIKSIGKDKNGDYYISPSTGKKVYKSGVKRGDHENPKTGEHTGVAEGKSLEPIKAKYNKYDESVDGGKKKCPPMSHIKKMCQDGKSVAEICKMHPDCDQAELKQMVADCKKKLNRNESYVAQAVAEAKKGKKPAFLDTVNDDEKDEPTKQAVADKKETVKENSELTRMRELAGRLNLNENVIVKESNEVDQLRALTKRLLG